MTQFEEFANELGVKVTTDERGFYTKWTASPSSPRHISGTASLLSEVNVKIVISASLLAGVLSLLTSLAGLPEVKDDNV